MEQIVNLHIEKLPEGVYLATSDDVPGLVAQGQTLAETLEIARDVARRLMEAQAARHTPADLFGSVSEENVARIRRQNSRKISVIIGNPPYNANQANENDNNKNREYPAIDARIKQTYIAASTARPAAMPATTSPPSRADWPRPSPSRPARRG